MGTVVYNLYAPNLICIGIDGEIMENILDGFGINIQMSRCPFKEPWRWYGR